MTEQSTQTNTHGNVILKKIIEEKISMRPKLLYRLRLALAIFLMVLITVVSIFLFSFISFVIRTNEQGQLLHFGFHGFLTFVFLFPWFLLLVDVVLVAFLEYLLRHFRFGYRRSIIYLLIALVCMVALLGIVVDHATNIHGALLRQADEGALPAFNGFYEAVHTSLPHEQGVCHCIITNIAPLTARDNVGVIDFPLILPDGQLKASLSKGDYLFMIGNFENGTFYANHIRVVNQ